MSNAVREAKIARILANYYDDDPEADLTDLLADLLHYAGEEWFEQRLLIAKMHYEAERGE